MVSRVSSTKKEVKDMDFEDVFEEEVSDDKLVIVLNNEPRVSGVMILPKTKKGAALRVAKTCVLYPGLNHVKFGLWKEAREHPQFVHDISEGKIVYNGAKSFLDLGQKKQIELAAKIYDKRLISHLKASTTDAEVLRALNTQLEGIDNGSRLQ